MVVKHTLNNNLIVSNSTSLFKEEIYLSIKHRSLCPVVRPGASRQFVAGGPGRTGTNREGIRVRSYIPGRATDQARFVAKSAAEPRCLYGESRK